MFHRRPHSAARRSLVGYEWAFASTLAVACSVFPDHAVLPAGAGGSATGGAGAGGNGVGGNAPGGAGAGGSAAGLGATGGDGAFGGGSGSPSTGGAEGGSAEAGSAGQGDTGGVGGSPEAGGSGGAGASSGGRGGAGCATPTVLSFAASGDTYLNQAKNQQSKNHGSETSLLVSGITDARERALVNFDLSTLPTGRAIMRAKLRFVLGNAVAGARTLSVYRVGRAWQEGKANWTRAMTGPAVSWSSPGGDTALLPSDTATLSDDALGAHLDFDVRTDIEALVPASYYGWLVDAATSDDVVQLASRETLFAEDRPSLMVELCP